MAKRHFEALSHKKDGSFVLVASSLTGATWDGFVWVFNTVHDLRQCPNLGMAASRTASGVSDVLWISDKDVVLACDSGELEVWSVGPPGNTLQYRSAYSCHEDMALCLCLLEGRERLVSGGADSRVILWDVAKQEAIDSFRAHRGRVLSLGAHPTSSHCFFSTSDDGVVRLWDTRKEKPASKIFNQLQPYCRKYCSKEIYSSVSWNYIDDKSFVLGSTSGVIDVFDMRLMDLVHTCNAHRRTIHRIAYAPWSGGILASVSDDKTVLVYDTKKKSKILRCDHNDFVHGLSWHPDNHTLLTCSWDGQVLEHTVTMDTNDESNDDEKMACNGENNTIDESDCDEDVKGGSKTQLERDSLSPLDVCCEKKVKVAKDSEEEGGGGGKGGEREDWGEGEGEEGGEIIRRECELNGIDNSSDEADADSNMERGSSS